MACLSVLLRVRTVLISTMFAFVVPGMTSCSLGAFDLFYALICVI